MDLLRARVALRERTMLDVVDLALRFFVDHWKAYALVAAWVLVPSFAMTWAVAAAFGWGVAWIAAVAWSTFAQAPFTVLASRLVFEENVRTLEVLGASLRAMPKLVLVRTVQLFLVLGGLFCLLGGFVADLYFFYAVEVVALERADVGATFTRMYRLCAAQTGELVMALLFLSALAILATFFGDVVGRAIIEDLLEIQGPASIWTEHGSPLAAASFWLFVPFGATCRFLLYLNGRTRSEGWDVQTRFAAIAAREDAMERA